MTRTIVICRKNYTAQMEDRYRAEQPAFLACGYKGMDGYEDKQERYPRAVRGFNAAGDTATLVVTPHSINRLGEEPVNVDVIKFKERVPNHGQWVGHVVQRWPFARLDDIPPLDTTTYPALEL